MQLLQATRAAMPMFSCFIEWEGELGVAGKGVTIYTTAIIAGFLMMMMLLLQMQHSDLRKGG